MNAEKKVCQNCHQNFVIASEDFNFYKKIDVPPPTWCPECRMMRRMAFWNEHNFFKKLEKRTGKEIFSMWPSEAPNEIYERDYWTSDEWDPKRYARDIDWSRPFLEQLRELQLAVPWAARAVQRMVNSDYSNNAADLKNCYMCFNADMSEDCMYGVGLNRMKSCIDFYQANHCELSYDFHGCANCYQCAFIAECSDCRDVWLSYDCRDCSDCFGCVNLQHKQYCIFNVQYTKEEYAAKLKEMNLGSYTSLRQLTKQFNAFMLQFPRKFSHGFQNKDSVGEYLYNSKNTKYSYLALNCENVKFAQNMALGLKDSYDYTNWGNNSELMYETIACGEYDQKLKFCWECWPSCQDLQYCMTCRSSRNLFGCVGLKRAEYCILNKQYTKEEYEALISKIKKHMDEMPYTDRKGRVYTYGEFFPLEFSFVGANESAVVDFMEMDKARALTNGMRWSEVNPKEYQVTTQSANLPDSISDTPADITKQVIACADCKRGYRLLPTEVEFLKRFSIPLPRKCHNCRFRDRIKARNLPKWFRGSCQCLGATSRNGVYKNIASHSHGSDACRNEFETPYAPDRPEIVYCEQCYQQEVV